MKTAIGQFEADFHQKPKLGGLLAWDNKAAFQHAYAEIARADTAVTPQQVADKAILVTKYGEARADAGYEVTAKISNWTQIVTGNPPRLADVPERPERVEATAVPRGK